MAFDAIRAIGKSSAELDGNDEQVERLEEATVTHEQLTHHAENVEVSDSELLQSIAAAKTELDSYFETAYLRTTEMAESVRQELLAALLAATGEETLGEKTLWLAQELEIAEFLGLDANGGGVTTPPAELQATPAANLDTIIASIAAISERIDGYGDLSEQGDIDEANTAVRSAVREVLGLIEGLDEEQQQSVIASQGEFLERMGIDTEGKSLEDVLEALVEVDYVARIREQVESGIQNAEVPTEAELSNIMARLEGLSTEFRRLEALGSYSVDDVRNSVFSALQRDLSAWFEHNEQALARMAQQAAGAESDNSSGLARLQTALSQIMGEGLRALDPESALAYALRGVDGVSENLLDPAAVQAALASGGADNLRTTLEAALKAKVDAAITEDNYEAIVEQFSGVAADDLEGQQRLRDLLQQVPEHWGAARIEEYQAYVEATGRGALAPEVWRAREIAKIQPAFLQVLAQLMDKLGPMLAQIKAMFDPEAEAQGGDRAAAIQAVTDRITGLQTEAAAETAFDGLKTTVEAKLKESLEATPPLNIAGLEVANVEAFIARNFASVDTKDALEAFQQVLESGDATISAARGFGLQYETLMALVATENTVTIDGNNLSITVPVENEAGTEREVIFTRNTEGTLSAEDETLLRSYLEGSSAQAETADEVVDRQRETLFETVRTQIRTKAADEGWDFDETIIDNDGHNGFWFNGAEDTLYVDLDNGGYGDFSSDDIALELDDDLSVYGVSDMDELIRVLQEEFSGRSLSDFND